MAPIWSATKPILGHCGLICGEHLMPLIRARMIEQGEDFHIAVFPGAFSFIPGPDWRSLTWKVASFGTHTNQSARHGGRCVCSLACGLYDFK